MSKENLGKVKVVKLVKALQMAEYSKQNSYVRSDNNIQDNYKKSYNNTTNSNNINTQMDND
jgi:hypothetical protein